MSLCPTLLLPLPTWLSISQQDGINCIIVNTPSPPSGSHAFVLFLWSSLQLDEVFCLTWIHLPLRAPHFWVVNPSFPGPVIKFKFIFSACCVKTWLVPLNSTPFPAGLMLTFVGRSCRTTKEERFWFPGSGVPSWQVLQGWGVASPAASGQKLPSAWLLVTV